MGLSSLSNMVRGQELIITLAKVKSFIPADRTKDIIISIFDDDVFLMALIMFSLPLLINILYIVLCFLKLKKLQHKQ